jgi:hypothetical protein
MVDTVPNAADILARVDAEVSRALSRIPSRVVRFRR